MSTDTKTDGSRSQQTEEPFHIVCSDNEQGPVMNVGICVNAPLREKLKKDGITNAHLFVVARQFNRDIVRKLVPIAKGHVHIEFDRPGSFTIDTMVVWPGHGETVSSMSSLLLGTRNGRIFDYDIYDEYEDHEIRSSFTGFVGSGRRERSVTVNRVQHHSSQQPVLVLADNFADPPPAWLFTIVRWYFADNDRDQCHFRRRTLWSIPLTLVVLPMHYLIKLVGLVLYGLTGFVYGLNAKFAVRPYRDGSLSLVFSGVKSRRSAWFYKRDKNEYYRNYQPRHWAWNTSVVLTVLTLVVSTVASFFVPDGWSWLDCLGVAVGVVALVVALIAIVAFVLWIGGHVAKAVGLGDKYQKLGVKFRDWRKQRHEQNHASEQEMLDRQLATMSCEATGGEMTIEHLVARRRFAPVVVWYSTKDRLCKPFAKG